MSRIPEYTVTNNPHGVMFFGPAGSRDKPDEGSQFTLVTKAGYIEHSNENGNTTIVVPQRFDEICGDQLDGSQKENIAKSIVAKQGDICIVSENGNIKLKAKNIFIETTGSENNGVFQVAANGQITLATGDNITIAGTKVCLRGESGIVLGSNHYIKLIGELRKGSPFESLPIIGAIFSSYIEGILSGCK